MTTSFTESVVEDAALAWLESLGYAVKHGPEIAPGELFAERGDYGQVILAIRLREALVRLNPTLPAEAIDDAFRKIIRLEGATLDARNRTFHRLLVDGVTVEYRRETCLRRAPGSSSFMQSDAMTRAFISVRRRTWSVVGRAPSWHSGGAHEEA